MMRILLLVVDLWLISCVVDSNILAGGQRDAIKATLPENDREQQTLSQSTITDPSDQSHAQVIAYHIVGCVSVGIFVMVSGVLIVIIWIRTFRPHSGADCRTSRFWRVYLIQHMRKTQPASRAYEVQRASVIGPYRSHREIQLPQHIVSYTDEVSQRRPLRSRRPKHYSHPRKNRFAQLRGVYKYVDLDASKGLISQDWTVDIVES